MSVGSALQSGLRLLVDRPARILPVFLLGIGLTATVRVPLVVGIGGSLALLASDGRLETLVSEFDQFARNAGLGSESMAGSTPDIPPGLETAVADAFSLPVVALLVGGGVVALTVGVVSSGLASAATLHGVHAALRGDDAVEAAVRGVGRDWTSFVGLSLLTVGLVAVGVIPVALGASLFALSPAAGTLAVAVGGLLGGGVVLVWLLALTFAGASVVVDDVGIGRAIANSARFPFDRPTAFVGYVVVSLGVFGLLAAAGSVFSALGVSRLSGLVGPLLLLPLLDIVRIALYADLEAPQQDENTISSPRASTPRRIVAAFRDGLVAVGGFVRGYPLAVAAATGLFALAAAGGATLTGSFGAELPSPTDAESVFGSLPVNVAVMLAANNWLVSATAAYGGVALGVPTAVDMLLNGFIVGALYGVVDPVGFAALVAPHGVLELPAIFVAGGL
ncbi:MAG: stage II sporulation protein M, partial [Haloarculaceae archaeon]